MLWPPSNLLPEGFLSDRSFEGVDVSKEVQDVVFPTALGEIGETFRRISWCSGRIVVKCWTVWDDFSCMFVFLAGRYISQRPHDVVVECRLPVKKCSIRICIFSQRVNNM